MLVRDRMTRDPVTIRPDTSFQDALMLMRDHEFRRLPIVDPTGKLVGIVSERDLLYASPSPASTLNVWEMNYLLERLLIGEIMTKEVITTTPETPLEDAARIMVEHKIGGLPVVDTDGTVIGVITETDIFTTFVEMFGGGRAGLRLTVDAPESRGVVLDLAETIYELGGNIISLGSFERTPSKREFVVKVENVGKETLIDSLEMMGDNVTDAREV